ncbi:helix-turn-helix transcriptional regulator [Phaeospirillum tilakii]|uniref:Helix-turn-helix transcriptional regulator n=1 Tax=Phaeospirillum tilakii TaxID=741673 RepID=A0ABW5CF02_9PROT
MMNAIPRSDVGRRGGDAAGAPLCLSAKEAAALCSVPVATLKTHGPKPVKLGRHNRWRVADLEAWVGGGKAAEQPAEDADEALHALEGLDL